MASQRSASTGRARGRRGWLVLACLTAGACSQAHLVPADAGDQDLGASDLGVSDLFVADTGPRDSGSVDAGADLSPVADAGTDAGPRTCDRTSALYFGTPARETSMLNVTFATGTHDAVLDPSAAPRRRPGPGFLSPDGLHWTGNLLDSYPCWDGDTSMGWFATLELVRASLGDPWLPPPMALLHCTSHSGHAQLTRDYRGMFGFHGGGHETMFQHRVAFTDRFNPWDGFTFNTPPTFATGTPDGGTAMYVNEDFSPSADGTYLAFSSNRAPSAPGDATPRTDDVSQIETFLALAVHAADPTMGYASLTALETTTPPPAGSRTLPMWLSDDGLRALLVSDRGGATWDVYLAQRADVGSAFGAPTMVAALSRADADERAVTLPSLDALIAHGCVGDGFLYRLSVGVEENLRFPVCLGAPCP